MTKKLKTTFVVMTHEDFMQRCFQLALNGLGNVAPNPLVGAVIVHDGNIIGEGFHAVYGQPHAEVMAIRNCKQPELLADSTMYVSLEPCSHFGKTPPCADLILEKKIPNVVVCNLDPFPAVAGRGIQKLRDAGVNVLTGVLAEEGEKLNRRFFAFHRNKRPFVILKWAQSVDGFIDGFDEKPVKITSPLTDQKVHQWRTEETGIFVGYNTALKDNPKLTARLFSGNNPQRIVWDPKLELPTSHHLFSDGKPTIIFNNEKEEEENNLTYLKIEHNNMQGMLQKLYEQNIQSVIVEGGAKTLQQFIDMEWWDEARIITGNISIGNGVLAPKLLHGILFDTAQSENDSIHYFKNSTTQQHDKIGHTGIRFTSG
jgi:diaminohydroxyphosphoribosylaminopyrimidine deaminase/5-amino-6-(5-phosphoribosylamino)uracil reductase